MWHLNFKLNYGSINDDYVEAIEWGKKGLP